MIDYLESAGSRCRLMYGAPNQLRHVALLKRTPDRDLGLLTDHRDEFSPAELRKFSRVADAFAAIESRNRLAEWASSEEERNPMTDPTVNPTPDIDDGAMERYRHMAAMSGQSLEKFLAGLKQIGVRPAGPQCYEDRLMPH